MMAFVTCRSFKKVINKELFVHCHDYGWILCCGCFQYFICNTLVCHVQWFTSCIIGHSVIMYIKMNTSPGHPNGCGVDVYYLYMAQNNAYRYGMTYLTLKSRSSRGNITHNKWERNWTSPFGVITHTPIAMYVITIIIMTLEMYK